MECNRDEANRAKQIAERKFFTKDIQGAKKVALKAQNLYPDLDGISQLIATLDVYAAAENKINGESDFYAILGVSPSADDDTVRKHYRKLALFLHPDKNKSIGADGAFKCISEAWSLLSDKAKRSAYDQKRNASVFKQAATQNGGTRAAPPPGQNGFYNFTKGTISRTKDTIPPKADADANANANANAPSSSKQTTLKTFWTVCHGCKMHYEYLRMYLHQNLLCPNCHEPFLAMETPAPNTKVSTKGFRSSKGAGRNASNPGRHRTTSQKGESSSFQWAPFSKTNSPASSVQAASMVHRAYEKVKREREEAQAAGKREEALRRKKNLRRTTNLSSSMKKTIFSNIGQVDTSKGVANMDIQAQLLVKARMEIKKKLHEWRLEKRDDSVNKKSDTKVDNLNGDSDNKNPIQRLMIDVPDPDFHDFDQDRSERCFKEGQIWAAYDDDDAMPRYYAMIRKINSFDPFKIKVRWLTSTRNNEVDRFSGSSKAFGEFKTGKCETISASNYFSHKVNLNEPGSIKIYPRIGDVWALYRNWSPEWKEETPNEVIRKYEIVEVDEYEEGSGFMVTQLVKVAGFKTVFHRQLNPKEARAIPESEIFRFSHQIPWHFLTGQEGPNAPKGCRELDPAATPVEFLEVIGDVKDDDDDDELAVLADVKEER